MGRACRLRAKSGIFILPEYWDEKKGVIKSTNRIQTQKVVEVNECKTQIESLCRIIEDESTKISIEEMSREWLDNVIFTFHNPNSKDNVELSFYEILEKFVDTETRNNWKPKTAQRFYALKNHLISYSDKSGVDVDFENINKGFIDGFVEYLVLDKKFRNATIMKTIKALKWFLKWALVNGYHNNAFFQQYAPSTCKQKSDNAFIVYLNNEELQQIKDYDFSNNERLDRVKDVFLFCCYSGLRYSDVEHMRQCDVYDDMLHITTIKTDDTITINLNNTTRSILEKYKTDEPNEKALPVVSNQKMNRYLKEMAQIVGISNPITKIYYIGNKRVEETKPKYEWIGTHTGRRTFICTMLSKGVAPQIVMKFTGHNSYNTMKPYIDITEKAKAQAMSLLDD
jgi:integrase